MPEAEFSTLTVNPCFSLSSNLFSCATRKRLYLLFFHFPHLRVPYLSELNRDDARRVRLLGHDGVVLPVASSIPCFGDKIGRTRRWSS